MTDARTLAERLFEVIDSHRWADVTTVLHLDAEMSSPFGDRLSIAAWLDVNRSFAAACPDGSHTITDVVDAGVRFAIEGIWTGTHTDPMAGPAGVVPPTGRSVVLPFCGIATRRDERILRDRLPRPADDARPARNAARAGSRPVTSTPPPTRSSR
ncbi:SnoaL-like protein [Blastococcus colisei]|uniref:SnoaL-like protein n=1 Tax=Blastococcus colisei TaxID=1564162 RepID=A0A543PFR7_9ACTN|nr:nuclear transport factor 2 family protein [Blastococcus colisei]TQN42922.1 SnoaL-like protein [Blastococcus colisei]